MALSNWELSYNGLTIGGSQPYGLINIEGLNPPDARVDEIEKQGDHGSYIYAQYLSARTITIEGDVVGSTTSEFDSRINALRGAFAPQASSLPLQMALPGGETKRVYCKPTRVQFPIDVNYEMMFETWTVELMAEDPRLYSDTLNVLSLMPYVANGVGFNLAFNVNFGGVSGGGLSQNAINGGTMPSYPTIVINGPITNPILRNITTSQSVYLNITLSAVETLTLDFLNRTILLGSITNRYSSFDQSSTWWTIIPGSNTLTLTGSDIAGSTKATVSYRSAWN